MVDFNKDAKDLLEYIGGPDNILPSVTAPPVCVSS